MIVTYKPEQGESQRWEWDPDRVRTSEAELCEKRFGDSWDKFKVGVLGGQSKARRVLLWHLMRLEHHTLRYEDVPDFYMGELTVEFTGAELAEIRARLRKAKIDDGERQEMLTALDMQEADAPTDGTTQGKARSKAASKGTGQR